MTERRSTLDARLAETIQEFEQHRAAAWNTATDRDEAWSELVEKLAELFVDKTDQLEALQRVRAELIKVDQQMELNFPEGILAMFGSEEEFVERIQIALAKKYATDTEGMRERCLTLGQWALDDPPEKKAVLSYLERLSRCYILGLDSECVILCRAVLENALKHAYQSEAVVRPADDRGNYRLAKDIDAAKFFGWFDESDRGAAHKVRIRGNRAVHNDPYTTQEVQETVKLTLDLVQKLP